jgi:hypothetical protein
VSAPEKQVRSSPRDYIGALVSGLPDKRRRSRLLVMLQAHIDDSGWDGKSPVFVLAGYVSTAERWQAFSDEWQAVLDLEKPRAIPGAFKMSQACLLNNYKSPFYRWTEKERDHLLIELVKVIKRHAMHGIVSVIPIEPYKRLLTGRFNPAALDRPYFLSFFGVLTNLLMLTHTLKLDDKIEIIFDDFENESKAMLMEEYERCIAVAPPDVRKLSAGYPIFKKDEDVKPLQAADFLAWHARRYYFDLYAGKDPTKERWNVFFANLFEPDHDILEIYAEDKIREVLEVLNRSVKTKEISMTLPDLSTFQYRS